VDWPSLEARAKRWDGVKIWKRACEAGMEHFYRGFYRFGSSYEHSDADDLVDLVIGCTFNAMAVLTEILVAAFKLSEAERIGKLRVAFAQLGVKR